MSTRDELWRVTLEGDSDRARDVAWELDSEIGRPTRRSADAMVDAFAEAMADPEFIRSPASHAIAEVLEMGTFQHGRERCGLTVAQHDKVLRAIELAWAGAASQLSFQFSVMLGERLIDADSLELLRRMSVAESSRVRAHVAHALEHYYDGAQEPPLKALSLGILIAMSREPDPDTRRQIVEYVFWLRTVAPGRYGY